MPRENEKPQGTRTANARRKYLHLLEGGTLKPHDLAHIVEAMEAQDARLVALETENRRLLSALREARGYVVHAAAGYPIDSCLAQIDIALQGDQDVTGT